MQIRTLDLFHGAGGSSTGAQMAGATIIAGIDFWNIAADSYSKNFPEAKTIAGDIREISPKKLHEDIGGIDLIVASPECTNHSCAKGGGNRCEESRQTVFQVIRFVREFKPKWIIIENVVQMESWSRHPDLLDDLWECGYYVRQEKLNAKDFGVPQSRRRLFLLCSLLGEADCVRIPNIPARSARSIIDVSGRYRLTPLRIPERAKPTIERAERAISELGPNVPFLIVYYGTDGSGGWQPINRPLRTVTTLDRFAYVIPSAEGHMMRMLQPEELKLAMGFPKSYKLQSGNRRDKVMLMGNAVCPPVMEAVVQSLVSQHSIARFATSVISTIARWRTRGKRSE